MVEFVDTHCHIQSAGMGGIEVGEKTTRDLWSKEPERQRHHIIADASTVGVTRIVCVGCDLEDSELAVDFVQAYAGCYASIGIHPHEAQHFAGKQDLLDRFAALAAMPKVVAVGECGLDYYYTHSPKAAQQELLHFQLQLAAEHDLPMIFHVREAFDDFWPIFEQYPGIRGVLHSFTDNQANLERALSHGLYAGVNGIATFTKSEQQIEMYKSIPLSNLLLETDAPFLTPSPQRGKICEPYHIKVIAEFLSELRQEPIGELAAATTNNAKQLFGIT